MEAVIDKNNDTKTLKSAYWNALFIGAEKLKLYDSELADITRINYKTLNGWHNNKTQELPFFDLTRSDGILVKQFIDLYINLRSMFVDPGAPAKWLRAINPSLKGKTPIEFMATEENGIFLVNSYLRSLASP